MPETLEEMLQDMREWLDQVCSQPIPPDTVAYNFNLSELIDGFALELIGASTYDLQDDDWACDECFVSEPRFFELTHELVGTDWERCLALVQDWLCVYLADTTNAGAPLRAARAVTIGFVDGDLIRVWPAVAAAG